MEKIKTIQFAGKNIVIAHIESYWLDGFSNVRIKMTSGEEYAEQTNEEVEAKSILKNIHDFINETPHV